MVGCVDGRMCGWWDVWMVGYDIRHTCTKTYIVLEKAQYKLNCTYLRLRIVLIQLSGQRYIHLFVFKVDN